MRMGEKKRNSEGLYSAQTLSLSLSCLFLRFATERQRLIAHSKGSEKIEKKGEQKREKKREETEDPIVKSQP